MRWQVASEAEEALLQGQKRIDELQEQREMDEKRRLEEVRATYR